MNKTEIKKIYKKFHTPPHIIDHMRKVAQLCDKLADGLIKKGQNIDKKSLIYAALLHDVIRVCDIKNFEPQNFPQKPTQADIRYWKNLRAKYGKIGHEEAMARLLEKIGESEIGNLVRKHSFFKVAELKTWEEKIIYYADKRVKGDKIVSLSERFSKSSKTTTREKDIEKKVRLLENQFRKILGNAVDKL